MTTEELGPSSEVAGLPWAGSEQGRPFLPLCQSVPRTSSSLPLFFFFLSRGEEQGEGKGRRQQYRHHTRYSVFKSRRPREFSPQLSVLCSLFRIASYPSLIIYCVPCHQGAEPPTTTARQGFLGEVRPDGAWLDSGCPFLLQIEVKEFSFWNVGGRSQSHSREDLGICEAHTHSSWSPCMRLKMPSLADSFSLLCLLFLHSDLAFIFHPSPPPGFILASIFLCLFLFPP